MVVSITLDEGLVNSVLGRPWAMTSPVLVLFSLLARAGPMEISESIPYSFCPMHCRRFTEYGTTGSPNGKLSEVCDVDVVVNELCRGGFGSLGMSSR